MAYSPNDQLKAHLTNRALYLSQKLYDVLDERDDEELEPIVLIAPEPEDSAVQLEFCGEMAVAPVRYTHSRSGRPTVQISAFWAEYHSPLAPGRFEPESYEMQFAFGVGLAHNLVHAYLDVVGHPDAPKHCLLFAELVEELCDDLTCQIAGEQCKVELPDNWITQIRNARCFNGYRSWLDTAAVAGIDTVQADREEAEKRVQQQSNNFKALKGLRTLRRKINGAKESEEESPKQAKG
jgi:hypothetical protein